MNYFSNINNIEELKKQYKNLAFRFHPDRGGSTAIMQEINAEYEKLQRKINLGQDVNIDDKFRHIIDKLTSLQGLEIEVCGSWIWISGDTKSCKDSLKEAGCYWASKKKMWYWRSESDAIKKKSNASMEDIRKKYGSERITIQRKSLAS